MTADRRLERLYPAFSAKERAILVLRAWKAGEDHHPKIRYTIPNHQVREYNRLIALMRVVDQEICYALLLIAEQVRHIDLRYGWMMSLVLWGGQTDALGELVLAGSKDRRLRADVRRLMKRAPGALRVPVDLTVPVDEPDIRREDFGPELVRALLIGIRQGLDQHWRELRSIEIVVDEVAAEFDGTDPLGDDDRQRLNDARATCVAVHNAIQSYVEPFPLPEPSDDDVALVQKLIERATES